MKNYDQSKKSKDEFLRTSALAMYMKGDANKIYTREELCEGFHICDREIRKQVAEMANYLPVLSLSKAKGYRVLCFDENTTIEELSQMLEDIQHQINEFQARCDNLRARMKPLVALKKVIEKKLQN